MRRNIPAEQPSLPLGDEELLRLQRMRDCAERELVKRRRLYPRWVGERRMTQTVSAQRLAEWESVCDALQPDVLPYERAVALQMIRTVADEVERRQRAYPRLVADGRMTQALADRELTEMREVLDWITRRARGEDTDA